MTVDKIPFCDEINDAGQVIADALMDDLVRLFARIRKADTIHFSLSRSRDMDSGIEFISAEGGIAILGCEDSLRGTFGFYFCDAAKPADVVRAGIHEVPRHAICGNLEHAIQIAELFFREGQLDRHFAWVLNIAAGNDMKYGNLLAPGECPTLDEFISKTACKAGT